MCPPCSSAVRIPSLSAVMASCTYRYGWSGTAEKARCSSAMPDRCHCRNLLAVEPVVLGVPAAVEDLRQADLGTRGLLRRALLQEAAQRCEAGAGTHQDHRRGRVGRRVE